MSLPFLSFLDVVSHKLWLSAILCARVASALNISIPLNAPSNAPVITPSLVSFSIEQDRWTDWVGTTSRNQFFFNTLDNLNRITGAPPHIRIGANSEDHTDWSASVQFSQATFPAPSATVPYPEASHIIVGDGYYETAKFLPDGTHVTWGVNFGQNNLTAAFLETKSIMKAFSSEAITSHGIVLDYLEIGNEPDLYMNNGLRPSSYNVTQCTQEWIKFATNVSAAAGLSSSTTRFLSGSLAGSSHTITGFSPQGMFHEGMLDSAPGKLITAFSEHRYSGSFCTGNGGLLSDLMTKSTIRGNLTVYKDDIAVVRAKGLDYILGETNSYACHGAPGVSNTAGAALWTLDYALFAPQVGMSRVFFHVGIGFKYSLIQPITLTRSTLDGSQLPAPLPPHVQPQYYAAIIAAEAIAGANTRAIELSIDHPQIAGYAFYEQNVLKRAVLINSKAFLQGNTNRSSVHLDITLASSGASKEQTPTRMIVKRLAIGHADDASGLTWGGQTYETADGRVSGDLKEDTVSITEGLDIVETEAVLLSFRH